MSGVRFPLCCMLVFALSSCLCLLSTSRAGQLDYGAGGVEEMPTFEPGGEPIDPFLDTKKLTTKGFEGATAGYGGLPFTNETWADDRQITGGTESVGLFVRGFIFASGNQYRVMTLHLAGTGGTVVVDGVSYRLVETSLNKGTANPDRLPEETARALTEKTVLASISARIVSSELKTSKDPISAAGQLALGTIGKLEGVLVRRGTGPKAAVVLEGGITEGELGGPLLGIVRQRSLDGQANALDDGVGGPAQYESLEPLDSGTESGCFLTPGLAPAEFDGLGNKRKQF